jgi:hypothetical protein
MVPTFVMFVSFENLRRTAKTEPRAIWFPHLCGARDGGLEGGGEGCESRAG